MHYASDRRITRIVLVLQIHELELSADIGAAPPWKHSFRTWMQAARSLSSGVTHCHKFLNRMEGEQKKLLLPQTHFFTSLIGWRVNFV